MVQQRFIVWSGYPSKPVSGNNRCDRWWNGQKVLCRMHCRIQFFSCTSTNAAKKCLCDRRDFFFWTAAPSHHGALTASLVDQCPRGIAQWESGLFLRRSQTVFLICPSSAFVSSAKMLSIVPLMNGGGMFETRTRPKRESNHPQHGSKNIWTWEEKNNSWKI